MSDPIAKEIRSCARGCFLDRYSDYEYMGNQYDENYFRTIKPLVSGPIQPKVLLISQSPSLQAWTNGGIYREAPDGGLVSRDNTFLVKDLLPVFDLGLNDIELFRDIFFWVHTVNCYPWFNLKQNSEGKQVRSDRVPSNTEMTNCIKRWFDRLFQLESIKLVVPMGEPALSLFLDLKDFGGYTNYMKDAPVHIGSVIPNKIFLPLFHQSKKSRVFNDKKCREANLKSIKFLRIVFNHIVKDFSD